MFPADPSSLFSFPKKSFHVLAGCFIDGTGVPLRRNVLIKIDAGRISWIKDVSMSETWPVDTFDLCKYLVMPGFVDCHVHLFMSGSADRETRKKQLNFTCREAKNAISRHLCDHIKCGIVAVRDGGDYGGFVSIYKDDTAAVKTHKDCAQARGDISRTSTGNQGVFTTAIQVYNPENKIVVSSAGKAIHAKGRYGRFAGQAVLTEKDMLNAVMGDGIDHVKIINSGLNSLKEFGKQTEPQFKEDVLKAAISAAHDRGLKVMVHANGTRPVKEAIKAGADSIEHGFFMGKENLQLMADEDVTWVPTAFTMRACMKTLNPGMRERDIARRNLEHQLEQIRLANTFGVTIAAGTDSGSIGVNHGSSLFEEIDIFMEAGLSMEKAVMCATWNGARLMGIEKRAGRLVTGMPAIFTAVPALSC